MSTNHRFQFQEADNKPGWHERPKKACLEIALYVEITEDLLLKFRNKGIEFSIDDLGTGFSSLSYLKEFDIDFIKIDCSFITNLNNNLIDPARVEAIIVMAHGFKTIAEGVETEEQQNLLMGFGCDYLQGIFYPPPISIEEFEKLIIQ